MNIATVRVDPKWRSSLVALVLVLAAIVAVYFRTAVGMVTIWSRSETFTHGFLVPPIALWLCWRMRGALVPMRPSPSLSAVGLMVLVGFLWLLGDLVVVNSVTQLAFVALMVLAVPAVLGWPVARVLAFPLGFLFFAVPLGEFLLPTLIEWTADFTVLALRLTGIPVFREGNQFVIPTGRWSVVEACSGVRYLIASLTVGTLFAYLNYKSYARRWLFVGVSILVPVLANWLRAYMIVMLGHLSNNRIATGVDHIVYGWVFFGVVIAIMFMVGARWADAPAGPATPLVTPVAHKSAAVATWVATVAAILVLAMPVGIRQAIAGAGPSGAPNLQTEALGAKGWQVVSQAPTWKPSFSGAAAESNLLLARDGKTVGVYLAYYRHQDYERKLVSSNNVLISNADMHWRQLSAGTHAINAMAAPSVFRTSRIGPMMSSPGQESDFAAWQIYWINGKWTSNDYLAKVYGAYQQLLGHSDDAAVLVLYAPVRGDSDAVTAETLTSFAAENLAAIDSLLQRAKLAQ
jgi:exosortase A